MGSPFQRIIPPVQTWSVMEIGEMYDASNLLTPNAIHGNWHRIFTPDKWTLSTLKSREVR